MTEEEFELKLMLLGWKKQINHYSETVAILADNKKILIPMLDYSLWNSHIRYENLENNGRISCDIFLVNSNKQRHELTQSEYFTRIIEIISRNKHD